MAKGGSDESFADVLNKAAEIPDAADHGASVDIPQGLFGKFPIPHGEPLIENEPPPQREDPNRLYNLPKYNLKAHIKRFIIGDLVLGNPNNPADVISQDDSVLYEELMNQILAGEAVLRWEERKVLNTGAVIITISYFSKKGKKRKSPSEILDPRPEPPPS